MQETIATEASRRRAFRPSSLSEIYRRASARGRHAHHDEVLARMTTSGRSAWPPSNADTFRWPPPAPHTSPSTRVTFDAREHFAPGRAGLRHDAKGHSILGGEPAVDGRCRAFRANEETWPLSIMAMRQNAFTDYVLLLYSKRDGVS